MVPGRLWSKFRADVRHRLATQAEEGERKQKPKMASLGLGIEVSGAHTVAIKEEPSHGIDQNFKLDNDCSFCDSALPCSPSCTLVALRKDLDAALATKKNRQSWKVIAALVEYCARHKAEASLEALPNGNKWPAQIDFACLGQ
jgi:hypothetical protein